MTPSKPLTYGVFVGVKLTPTLAQAVKTQAKQSGSTVSDVIRTALKAQLNSPEANNG